MTVAQILPATVTSLLGDLGLGIYLLLFFSLLWFYPVAFEVWRRGATPGKSALGLQVVHDDGTPVGLPASLLRICCVSPISCPSLTAPA